MKKTLVVGGSFPAGAVTVGLFLSVALLGLLGLFLYDSYRLAERMILQEGRLRELSAQILHLDEVLTMSARMSAATGDPKWEKRYRVFEPQLDGMIKETIRIAPGVEDTAASKMTDQANLLLVEMENRSFEAVGRGELEEARQILFSTNYEEQKQIYARGMRELSALLHRRADQALAALRKRITYCGLAGLAVFLLLLGVWRLVLRTLGRWERTLRGNHEQLVLQAEELARLNIDLDRRVNERTVELAQANKNLEDRLQELEFMNKAMMGREEKILELKEQIRALGSKGPE